ncbi:MAG: DUF2275 domain-containing protein [Thermodesulfovibrionales bacterium]
MKCDKIQEQLAAYIEDALSPAEKGIIDDHLMACPECRKALADLEMTISSIKGLDEISPPAWLTQKIMTRVKAEAERKKRSLLQKLFYPLYIKLPIEAIGIFLVAITALYVFRNIEPELKSVAVPSEDTVTEYTPREKTRKSGPKIKRQSQPPAVALSKKDEAASDAPSLQGSGQPSAPLPEQFMYDKESSVREKRTEVQEVPEKKMLQKGAPAPAGMSAQDGLKLERAPQAAGKIASGLSEKEEISLSFTVSDIDLAKKELGEALTDLGGKVVREERASDALIIIGELGSDKMLSFMKELKTLGYVKERTPTPMSDKDRVLIKITVSEN